MFANATKTSFIKDAYFYGAVTFKHPFQLLQTSSTLLCPKSHNRRRLSSSARNHICHWVVQWAQLNSRNSKTPCQKQQIFRWMLHLLLLFTSTCYWHVTINVLSSLVDAYRIHLFEREKFHSIRIIVSLVCVRLRYATTEAYSWTPAHLITW